MSERGGATQSTEVELTANDSLPGSSGSLGSLPGGLGQGRGRGNGSGRLGQGLRTRIGNNIDRIAGTNQHPISMGTK